VLLRQGAAGRAGASLEGDAGGALDCTAPATVAMPGPRPSPAHPHSAGTGHVQGVSVAFYARFDAFSLAVDPAAAQTGERDGALGASLLDCGEQRGPRRSLPKQDRHRVASHDGRKGRSPMGKSICTDSYCASRDGDERAGAHRGNRTIVRPLSHKTSTTSRYAFDNDWEQARQRLGALEGWLDPGTRRTLEARGVAGGWTLSGYSPSEWCRK
jgi:hypothetical protein